MEQTVVKLAEALVFVGVLRWHLVREPEEEESERFSWDEVEAGTLDLACAWLGLGGAVKGMSGFLHLFEPVYNWGVKLVFVSDVSLEIAAGWECFWAERAVVPSRESTKELMEVEVTKRRCDELPISAVEEGEVAVVHPAVMECLWTVSARRRKWWGLFDLLSSCRVGHVFVDEMGFEMVPVFERFQAEETVVVRLVLAGALVVVGPVVLGGDE
jgi:hypothetical protein